MFQVVDSATGEQVRQAVPSHRRRKKMAVLFLDVDRFTHVNGSLGHVIGDRCCSPYRSGC